MKIGIIADIHSNIYGLQAVLQELENIDTILCAGDIVGYYTFVNEVFDELRKRNIKCILGNHDAYLLGRLDLLSFNPSARASLLFTRDNIAKNNLDYLENIGKAHLDIEIDGLKISIRHGSPWNELEEYIYPDYLKFERFQQIEADLVILGHTHWPMIKRVGKVMVLNPGSCGQPRDYNPQASYAIFDTKTRDVIIKRIEYDVNKVCRGIQQKSLDKELIKILKRTK